MNLTIRNFLILTNFFLLCLILISCSIVNHIENDYDAEISFADDISIADSNKNITFIQMDNNNITVVKTLTKDSNLISIESFIDYKKSIHYGESRYFHTGGKLKTLINYNKMGKLDGELKTFYENGTLRRNDYFKDGKLDSGQCFDLTGKEIQHYPYIVLPIIDLDLISLKLTYPENLRKFGSQEKILIRVYVDSTSTPIKFKYSKKHSQEFIDEIIRVLTSYRVFRTGEIDGYPVGQWLVIPFMFRLH
jgi:hypothetical protein